MSDSPTDHRDAAGRGPDELDVDLLPDAGPVQARSAGRSGGSRWLSAVLVVVLLGFLAFIAMSRITVDGKVISSPGSVLEIESVVEVNDGPFFPSEGEVFLTTVRSNLQPTVLDWIGAKLDDSVVILDAEDVLGDRTVEENRTLGRQQMAQSQEIATRVALEYLGYEVITEAGALIQGIAPDTPAEDVLSPGDVVISAESEPVLTSVELAEAVREKEPGDDFTFVILEADGSEREETVVLSENEGVAFLGVSISTFVEMDELPFEISVNSRAIGGPSAGLALTLSLIDLLTEGELTGGAQIATTGTIDPLGNVGPIGGIEQKTHAVIRSGVTLFLVPSANFEAAQEVAANVDRLDVVAVDTLEEALAAVLAHGGEPVPVG